MIEFTRVTWIILFCGINQATCWCVAMCLMMGNFISFSSVALFDKTVYRRMRAKRNWSPLTFYGGHVLLHVLPLSLLYVYPTDVTVSHSLLAVAVHSYWWYVVECTIGMNQLYVPLQRKHWNNAFLVAFIAELSMCVMF